jgi:hypothetical protein
LRAYVLTPAQQVLQRFALVQTRADGSVACSRASTAALDVRAVCLRAMRCALQLIKPESP